MVQPPRGVAPPPVLSEGKSIESWSPEKPDNKPLFAQQDPRALSCRQALHRPTVTSQLRISWGMDFLPDGKVLVTERLPGALRIVDAKGMISPPLTGIAAVLALRRSACWMWRLIPAFAGNKRIFLTFFETSTKNPGPAITNSNTMSPAPRWTRRPMRCAMCRSSIARHRAWPSRRLGAKTGGRIAFGPDGSLFVVIGDRDDNPSQTVPDWMSPQQLDNDLGKTIHITADGLPAPGNPYLKTPGARPAIWSIGHRSSPGLAFQPSTGLLWQSELGPRGGDEINILRRGGNFGWPVLVNGIDYPGTLIGDGSTDKPGMVPPVYYWDPSRNPSGIAFYDGKLFPQWRGNLFVAMLNGKFLDRLTIKGGKVVAEEPLLMELKSRIRDVGVGPDGAVYVLTDGGTDSMSIATAPSSSLLRLMPR